MTPYDGGGCFTVSMNGGQGDGDWSSGVFSIVLNVVVGEWGLGTGIIFFWESVNTSGLKITLLYFGFTWLH